MYFIYFIDDVFGSPLTESKSPAMSQDTGAGT